MSSPIEDKCFPIDKWQPSEPFIEGNYLEILDGINANRNHLDAHGLLQGSDTDLFIFNVGLFSLNEAECISTLFADNSYPDLYCDWCSSVPKVIEEFFEDKQYEWLQEKLKFRVDSHNPDLVF